MSEESKVETSKMRMLVEAYYDIQKVRIEQGNRIKDLVRREVLTDGDAKSIHYHTEGKLKSCENDISSALKKMVEIKPVWEHWLKHVNGVGHILAAGLIAFIDPERSTNVSKIWAYAGLHLVRRCEKCDKRAFETVYDRVRWTKKMNNRFVSIAERRKDKKVKIDHDSITKKVNKLICDCGGNHIMVIAKRKKGELGEWNPKLKTLCWKIGESFVKKKGAYRSFYDKYKAEEQKKNPEMQKAQIHARAKRKTVKLFLGHFLIVSRKHLGLDTRSPYALEKLDHEKMIAPLIDGPSGEIVEV